MTNTASTPLATPTSGWATASLTMGVLGLLVGCCTFGIPSALAVVFGHLALRETRTGERTGHGAAIAGLILGYLLVLPMMAVSIALVAANVAGWPPGTSTP